MKRIDLENKRILISRTDSIGDVMLTLPICAWLKNEFPGITILFLGRSYTEPIIKCYSAAIDQFVNWDDYTNVPKTEKIQSFRKLELDAIIHVFPSKDIAALAKKARIPVRIGTSHRPYHMVTCSHRVNFTRKRSDLHEAQLNFELLRPFGLQEIPSLKEVTNYTAQFIPPTINLPKGLDALKNVVILHPKSQGSAKEWPLNKYMELSKKLTEAGRTVVFTGTKAEGDLFRDEIPQDKQIVDSTGKFTLPELIAFIAKAEVLVACSTGPLHIAGFLGVRSIGLFSPKRPIHPGRWSPLGKHVRVLVDKEDCPNCKQGKDCTCIQDISVEKVFHAVVDAKP